MDYELLLLLLLFLPEEFLCVAHVDHVVLPSHLLEVQGDELRLVAVDSLLRSKANRSQSTNRSYITE